MIPLLKQAHQLPLTENERAILAYCEQNTAKVAHMSLKELCAQVYLSSASIVRFCQKLGLSGYNDFKYQLRSELQSQRGAAFDPDGYIRRSVMRFKDNLAAQDLHQLQQVAALLTSGRPIYIYGTNLSALPARYLQTALASLDQMSIRVEWGDLLEGLVRNMNADAVLLLISAKGVAGRYVKAFEMAQARGVTTVLLTSNQASPLIPYSSLAICTNDPHNEFHHTDVNDRLGFFTVVQILIEFIAHHNG